MKRTSKWHLAVVKPWLLLFGISAGLLGLGCGAGPITGPTGASKQAAKKKRKKTKYVTPARLVPEIDLDDFRPLESQHGHHYLLVSGLRIVQRDDGIVERADERFPSGPVYSERLPDRLGGGYVFYQTSSSGTRLWRAASWIGKLKPLTHLAQRADELVPGFDCLYVRTRASNWLMALEPDSGAIRHFGQLPAAGSYGAMAFADGWRGVIDTDLRGPLASFDAGTSWHSLGISARIRSATVRDGDPLLFVDGGYFRLDVRGHLQFFSGATANTEFVRLRPALSSEVAKDELPRRPRSHPLGGSPLRTAVLRGWPDSPTSAVVAHEGKLVRVSLPDGGLLAVATEAYPEDDALCQGVALGQDFGFVCGAPQRETVIYEFVAPLRLQEVARFSKPRFVASSGNGGLVIRGGCEADSQPTKETRAYCVFSPDGKRREIGVKGDLGAERVIGLKDDRVVVLVPPRSGTAGRVTTIRGDSLKSVELKLPDGPRRAVRLARRGLWMEGFQQRSKNAVAGWIEAGGPVIGVTVKLDGKVKLGKVYDMGGQVLVSGRFGLAAGETDGGYESTDWGKTWRSFELPGLPHSRSDAKSRGCSPVGCGLRTWLRVGWGKSKLKDDLEIVKLPESKYVRPAIVSPVHLDCTFIGPKVKKKKPAVPTPPPPPRYHHRPYYGHYSNYGTWTAFHGIEPPKLGKDQVGVGRGTSNYEPVTAHVYVWGPKGADWTRAGRWMMLFYDRFDPRGGIRRSARTRPPWADEATAADAIGAQRYGGYRRWQAFMDPSGRAALLASCYGSQCTLYAVTEGRSILPLRHADGSQRLLPLPIHQGAVRVGEVWYYLTETYGSSVSLWRAELGMAAVVGNYPRLSTRRYSSVAPAPKLVRRVGSSQIGLLTTSPADPSTGSTIGKWVVLPIDLHSGALGKPVPLGRADLAARLPARCSKDQDGWLVETSLPTSTVVNLRGNRTYLDNIEYRLRLDPNGTCVEAIAANVGRSFTPPEQPRRPGRPVAASGSTANQIPTAIRLHDGSERWHLACQSPSATLPPALGGRGEAPSVSIEVADEIR